jgi:hypothetical protein
MISLAEKRKNQGNKLIDILSKIQGATVSPVENEVVDVLVLQLISLLDEFSVDLLPYGAISQFVFNNDSQDFMYFIEKLEEMIFEVVIEEDGDNYKKCLKLLEHLELAQQQRDALFEKQAKEIERLKRHNVTFIKNASQLRGMSDEIKELQETSKNMTTNFITILGIFAAILMGAFGAIQGFTSLFSNAHNLGLGKLLIISSVGASSVVLILFLLLNGIAKLTSKSLSSSSNDKNSFIEKHPTLVIVYGILIFISLIGTALELSNVKLQFAIQGLWWFAPFLWIAYFITGVKRKDLLFFIKHKTLT